MKRLVPVGVATGLATLAISFAAPGAEAATGWQSAGLGGVDAHGSYSRTGSTVHFYGRLYDTAADSESVEVLVRFSGECCAHAITNSHGRGSSVPIDLKSTHAAHVDVKEIRYNSISYVEGNWHRVY